MVMGFSLLFRWVRPTGRDVGMLGANAHQSLPSLIEPRVAGLVVCAAAIWNGKFYRASHHCQPRCVAGVVIDTATGVTKKLNASLFGSSNKPRTPHLLAGVPGLHRCSLVHLSKMLVHNQKWKRAHPPWFISKTNQALDRRRRASELAW